VVAEIVVEEVVEEGAVVVVGSRSCSSGSGEEYDLVVVGIRTSLR
jgi:hypothetical protein